MALFNRLDTKQKNGIIPIGITRRADIAKLELDRQGHSIRVLLIAAPGEGKTYLERRIADWLSINGILINAPFDKHRQFIGMKNKNDDYDKMLLRGLSARDSSVTMNDIKYIKNVVIGSDKPRQSDVNIFCPEFGATDDGKPFSYRISDMDKIFFFELMLIRRSHRIRAEAGYLLYKYFKKHDKMKSGNEIYNDVVSNAENVASDIVGEDVVKCTDTFKDLAWQLKFNFIDDKKLNGDNAIDILDMHRDAQGSVNRNCIIDFSNVSKIESVEPYSIVDFYVGMTMIKLMEHREQYVNTGKGPKIPPIAFLIDEGQATMVGRKGFTSKAVQIALTEGRKFGISLVIAIQGDTSQISPLVMENVPYIFLSASNTSASTLRNLKNSFPKAFSDKWNFDSFLKLGRHEFLLISKHHGFSADAVTALPPLSSFS